MRTDAGEISPGEFLQLIADSGRWQLLGELARSDRRTGELSELLSKPQNLVSYHLGELREAGLVSARRSSADGRDTYYRVDLERCGELLSAAGAALQPGMRLDVLPSEQINIRRRPVPRVLFLCTGNSARSQMAEALVEHRSGHRIRACSAGSHPKALHPNAVRVMAERGIDISGRLTKHLSRFAATNFDRVITLCDKVREICPEFPGEPSVVHWSMPDPAAEGDTTAQIYRAFRGCADELETRIRFLIAHIATEEQGRKTSHVH